MAAGNLTAWNVEASNFPASGTVIEKARFAVRYAILAPSSHNTQPWRFIVNGDELLVCADRTRSLANIDPFDRELIISCGAALFNLRVALAFFGVPIEITVFPQSSDPDIVARVVFPASGPMLKDLAALFNAITNRTTNRGPFSEEVVPAVIVERLKSAAASEGVDVACAQKLAQRGAWRRSLPKPIDDSSTIRAFGANLPAGFIRHEARTACRPPRRGYARSRTQRRRLSPWPFALLI